MIKENIRKIVLRGSNNLLELSSKRNILVDLVYKIYMSRTHGSKNQVTGSIRGIFMEVVIIWNMLLVLCEKKNFFDYLMFLNYFIKKW